MGAHRRQPDYVMNTIDVTTSREFNVVYTNYKSKTLYIDVTIFHNILIANGHAYCILAANGLPYMSGSGLEQSPVMACYSIIHAPIKANNGTYSIVSSEANGTNTIISWIESY